MPFSLSLSSSSSSSSSEILPRCVEKHIFMYYNVAPRCVPRNENSTRRILLACYVSCRSKRVERERSCRGNGRRLQLFFAAVDEEPRSSANKSLTLAVTSSMCVSLVSYLRIPRQPVLLAFYPTISSINSYNVHNVSYRHCLASLDPRQLFENRFDIPERKIGRLFSSVKKMELLLFEL